MNNTTWYKITNFKLFNKTIFTKEEVCKEAQFEGMYQIYVNPDYYDKEFNTKKEDK